MQLPNAAPPARGEVCECLGRDGKPCTARAQFLVIFFAQPGGFLHLEDGEWRCPKHKQVAGYTLCKGECGKYARRQKKVMREHCKDCTKYASQKESRRVAREKRMGEVDTKRVPGEQSGDPVHVAGPEARAAV